MDIGMKRNIVLFTSQMIKKEGIRAVRMDDIAKEMTNYLSNVQYQARINKCLYRPFHSFS